MSEVAESNKQPENEKQEQVYIPKKGDVVNLYWGVESESIPATVTHVHAPGNDRTTVTAEFRFPNTSKQEVIAFNRAVTKQGYTYEYLDPNGWTDTKDTQDDPDLKASTATATATATSRRARNADGTDKGA